MDFSTVIIIIVAVVALLFFLKSSGGSENIPPSANVRYLISDDAVTVEMVINYLAQFKLKARKDRKNGFSERDIQDELEVYFKNIFRISALKG